MRLHVCVQVDTLQFLALRRKLSGRQAADANDSHKLSLDQACKQLAAQMPQPDRAVETLGQLMQVRDNHAFAVMQTALAPGASQEVGPGGRLQRQWACCFVSMKGAVLWHAALCAATRHCGMSYLPCG